MSQKTNDQIEGGASSTKKRKQPSACDARSAEPTVPESHLKSSVDGDSLATRSTRKQPGSNETFEGNLCAVHSTPPLNDQEIDFQTKVAKPLARAKEPGMNTALKKLLFMILGGGCLMIGSIVILDFILLLFMVMAWPVWAQWAVGMGFLILVGFLAVRIRKSINRVRRSPVMAFDRSRKAGDLSGDDREHLQKLLELQLSEILKTSEGRPLDLISSSSALLEKSGSMGSGSWLREYKQEIHAPLVKLSTSKVNALSLSAGASAALSPWRALDACIALNASVECATLILKDFGVRPNSFVVLKFAFDAFLATFLALGAQDAAETFASEATEHITSELGKTVASKVMPKIAEGLTIALFVRRVGRRMLKQMEFSV